MKRFIKVQTSDGDLYFPTFSKCLHYFKIIDKQKLRDKDKDTERIYGTHYTKFAYWKFQDCIFDFGIVTRIDFTVEGD